MPPAARNSGSAQQFFHEEDLRYLRFLIPEGLRVLELGCGIGNTLAGLQAKFRSRRRFQSRDGRGGAASSSGPAVSGRRCRRCGISRVAAGAFRRHSHRRHHRLARRLPGHVRGLHGLANEKRGLSWSIIRICGSRSYVWLSGSVGVPTAEQNVFSPADIHALGELVGSGGDQVRMPIVVATAFVRDWTPDQSLHLNLAAYSSAEPAPLFGVPFSSANSRQRAVRVGHHSGPQRARKYRGGNHAHAAVLRRPRNNFRRGSQQGWHGDGNQTGRGSLQRTGTSR